MPLRQLKVPRHDARHFFLIETRSPPGLLAPTLVTLPSISRAPRAPLKLARLPAYSLLPSSLHLDHSHCPLLVPATLAALPSTRAIETRSLPGSLAATHRGFCLLCRFPQKLHFPRSRRVLSRAPHALHSRLYRQSLSPLDA
jgi:hypothetical protein